MNDINITSADLGGYVIETIKTAEPPIHLNDTKLQKLIYILHGFILAVAEKDDIPVTIDEAPKAWPYGPVYPKALKRFKKTKLVRDNFTEESSDKISAILRDLSIDDFDHSLRSLGEKTAKFLSDWSHQTNSPWDKALKANGGKYNNPISADDMASYFQGFVK